MLLMGVPYLTFCAHDTSKFFYHIRTELKFETFLRIENGAINIVLQVGNNKYSVFGVKLGKLAPLMSKFGMLGPKILFNLQNGFL